MTEPWYVKAYDEHYYEVYGDEFTPEQTRAEVNGVIGRLALAPGSRVLDLCCGFGRHSLELARRGFRVTGLDLSPDLLRHARAASEAERLNVAWVEADMCEIPTPTEPYDAVMLLFSSFGVFDSDDEEARVLQAVARVLQPDGAVAIDTLNREAMLRHWMPLRWQEKADGTLLLNKMRFDVLAGVWHSREIIVFPDGRRFEDEHRLRLWTFTELSGMLTRNGFADVKGFGGLDGRPYTTEAHRMVVTARRSD